MTFCLIKSVLLQRKTTGWAHSARLLAKEVSKLSGVEYLKVDDQGLHIKVNDTVQLLAVDNVIICAGQEPLRELAEGLNKPFNLVGGIDVAAERVAGRMSFGHKGLSGGHLHAIYTGKSALFRLKQP